jgi:flavin reductase (DIM6/NTAB) family NADH-FMN oxidoreductase RutF
MTSTSHATAPDFSTSEFRAALGRFVTACAADGTPVGLTASSFNSVSLQPPLVLWSLARSASAMPAFEQGSHYAIHILAADQRALAERFAGKAVERFRDLPYQRGTSGAPVLEGAIAVFECFNRSRYQEGDHVIFVGEVERCSYRIGTQPLIYHGGQFYTELPL